MAPHHSIHAGVLGLLMLGACASADEPAPMAIGGCYTVFFNFDSSVITDTADATLRQFAQSFQQSPRSRAAITAHTDRSGSPDYNAALSLRRAEALKARLVALGVPDTAIATSGKGETQPLVETGDGVKEPQNRRADLVFN